MFFKSPINVLSYFHNLKNKKEREKNSKPCESVCVCVCVCVGVSDGLQSRCCWPPWIVEHGLPTWHAQAGPHPALWARCQCSRDLRWTPAQEGILSVASTFKLKPDALSASQVLQVAALFNPPLCHLKSGDNWGGPTKTSPTPWHGLKGCGWVRAGVQREHS